MNQPPSTPLLRLRRDPNGNLSKPVFPLLLPATHGWQPGQILRIDAQEATGLEPFPARLLTLYPYPSLAHVSAGLLQLLDGQADAEHSRAFYARHYRRYLDLETTPFHVLILHRCR
ncbi:MAG: hypothetical protein D6722_16685 [Bacteroidetes bacterium]|nr:MAG: hypothetical protein D6722_16685 [Bacteroidota bacterium]